MARITLLRDCLGNPCKADVSCAREYLLNAVILKYSADFGVEKFRLLPDSTLKQSELTSEEVSAIEQALLADLAATTDGPSLPPIYADR